MSGDNPVKTLEVWYGVTAVAGAIIWYSSIPVPPITFDMVTSLVIAGQVTGVLVNSKSVGGFNASMVISLVTAVQILVSLIVMVYVPCVKFVNTLLDWKFTPSILYS